MNTTGAVPPALPIERSTAIAARWWLLAALSYTALVYAPIVRHYFTGDDFLNLYQIANFSGLEYLLTPNGGHVLVARNAVFAAMMRLFGLRSEYYFVCVLLTHLVNVWLVFHIIRLCTSSARTASFGAALWGTSPLHGMTLGYYAVFGHAMVATAMLVIFHQALRLRLHGQRPSPRQQVLWYGLALIGATSFGTGIAAAALLPLALFFLLPKDLRRWWRRVPLASLVVVIPLLYFALLRAHRYVSGVVFPDLPVGFMLAHAWIIVLATVKLAAFGLIRLLLGFWVPNWPFLWIAYLLLAGLLAGAVVAAREGGPRRGVISATLVLAVSCYLAVAIGRGAYALKAGEGFLGKASHYHYTGTLFLTIVGCIVIAQLWQRQALVSARTAANLLAGWYAMSVATYFAFGPTVDSYAKGRTLALNAMAGLRDQIHVSPQGQPVYIKNRSFAALPNYVISASSFPGLAGAFCIYFPSNIVDGRQVYFIETNPDVLAATRRGRRTGTLFVPEAPIARNDRDLR